MCCVQVHLPDVITQQQHRMKHVASTHYCFAPCVVCSAWGDMVHNSTAIRSAHDDHATATIASVSPMAAASVVTVKQWLFLCVQTEYLQSKDRAQG